MHNMILGVSESGKTLLAKLVCARIKKKGVKTAVLDPMLDPEWDCDFITDNPEDFLAFAKNKDNMSSVLFVDEGSQSIGRYNPQMEWIVTQSRHWGHSAWIICQGASQLSPIVRDQTSQLFLFAVGESTMRIMGEHFRQDLTKLDRLNRGEFYAVSKWVETKKCKIVLPDKRIPLQDLKVSYNGTKSDKTPESQNEKTAFDLANDVPVDGSRL